MSASLSAEGAAELPASPLAPPHRFAFGEGYLFGFWIGELVGFADLDWFGSLHGRRMVWCLRWD